MPQVACSTESSRQSPAVRFQSAYNLLSKRVPSSSDQLMMGDSSSSSAIWKLLKISFAFEVCESKQHINGIISPIYPFTWIKLIFPHATNVDELQQQKELPWAMCCQEKEKNMLALKKHHINCLRIATKEENCSIFFKEHVTWSCKANKQANNRRTHNEIQRCIINNF